MPRSLLYALTAILYVALAAHFWLSRRRPSAAHPARLASWERLAIGVPFALHTFLLYDQLVLPPDLHFGFSQALSVTLWLAVAIYWCESLFVDLAGMHALVLPIAAVCVVLPGVFPGLAAPASAGRMAFRAHLALGMAAYSFFTIGALHALLMAFVERHLHRDRPLAAEHGADPLAGPLASLPPLLTLERLLFRILAIGFVLLTLTLATGALFSEETLGVPLRFDHKTVFAIAAWIIFGLLIAGRYRYGWRGRRALRWTLAGFVALLLAYVGSRFVLEVLLERTVR
jgi:ABC-type uncharacterized transport system permease subunit